MECFKKVFQIKQYWNASKKYFKKFSFDLALIEIVYNFSYIYHYGRLFSDSFSKKLGIKQGFSIKLVNEPTHYLSLFSDFPLDIEYVNENNEHSIDFIHLFCKTFIDIEKHAPSLMKQLKKDGLLWVSWPKGSSSIQTELKREPVRDYMLQLGLVDVKVCAVDDDWSGLKFVYRLKDRT